MRAWALFIEHRHTPKLVLTTTKMGDRRGKGRGFSLLSLEIAILHFEVKIIKIQCSTGTGLCFLGFFLGVHSSIVQIPRGVCACLGWPGALLAQLAALATVSVLP